MVGTRPAAETGAGVVAVVDGWGRAAVRSVAGCRPKPHGLLGLVNRCMDQKPGGSIDGDGCFYGDGYLMGMLSKAKAKISTTKRSKAKQA